MATLSSTTSFQDGDPATPSHFNAKIDSLVSNIATINSSNLTTGAFYSFNVRDYGATGNGVTDDTPSIQSALDAASISVNTTGVQYPTRIRFPRGVYRVTSTLTANCSVTVLDGDGPYASYISSDHSRRILHVGANANYLTIDGITIYGSGWTYNGTRADENVGVYIPTNNRGFTWVGGSIESTGSFCVFFEVDGGIHARILNCDLSPSLATTTRPLTEAAIGQRGVDAGARPRFLSNVGVPYGGLLFEVQGSRDLLASNCFAYNLSIGTACLNTYLFGMRLGTEGSPTTLAGTAGQFIGNHAGHISLHTGSQGWMVLASTESGVIDNAAPGANMVLGGTPNNIGDGYVGRMSRFLSTHSAAAATLPQYAFSSESSLGLYRSEASVIRQSYGAFQATGFRSAITTVSGNYTLGIGDCTVSVNSTSTTTITLPAASTVTGQLFNIQRHSTGTVVIQATSGGSLNASANTIIGTQFQSLTFQSYGTGYLLT